jgi:hypothetical protein
MCSSFLLLVTTLPLQTYCFRHSLNWSLLSLFMHKFPSLPSLVICHFKCLNINDLLDFHQKRKLNEISRNLVSQKCHQNFAKIQNFRKNIDIQNIFAKMLMKIFVFVNIFGNLLMKIFVFVNIFAKYQSFSPKFWYFKHVRENEYEIFQFQKHFR